LPWESKTSYLIPDTYNPTLQMREQEPPTLQKELKQTPPEAPLSSPPNMCVAGPPQPPQSDQGKLPHFSNRSWYNTHTGVTARSFLSSYVPCLLNPWGTFPRGGGKRVETLYPTVRLHPLSSRSLSQPKRAPPSYPLSSLTPPSTDCIHFSAWTPTCQ
jgi:hypothetical protein